MEDGCLPGSPISMTACQVQVERVRAAGWTPPGFSCRAATRICCRLVDHSVLKVVHLKQNMFNDLFGHYHGDDLLHVNQFVRLTPNDL